jgi:hypothetical protein
MESLLPRFNASHPFIRYHLGILQKAYNEFEERTEYLSHKSRKTDRIKAVINHKFGKITKREIMKACPDISKITVERTLTAMTKNGYLTKIGVGAQLLTSNRLHLEKMNKHKRA